MTFARLFSLNFSSKSPWCSPVPLKFESYNLHHCKKNCCKLVFLVFTEQLLYQIISVQLDCYEVTLVKMYNKLLPQKSETKVFNQKRLIKNLLKVSEKNNSGVSRINQIMYKLLILSKRLQFWTCQAFSHFTFHKPFHPFPYDCWSVSIVLQPSLFFPKLCLIFQFIIIKNCTNKKSVGKLVKRWTCWWSS